MTLFPHHEHRLACQTDKGRARQQKQREEYQLKKKRSR